jgi:uncharacterized damage-inducible protein DinB
MATWQQFEEAAPELAVPGWALWQRHRLMYLGTTRPNGSPRVHPVSPILADGAVFVAVSPRSPKWRDLVSDPRCVLHCLPGERDDEFVLRCRGRERPDAREAVRTAAAHVIHDDDHVIELDIEQAEHGWWEHVGRPGTYSIRRRWTPGGGVERRPGLRAPSDDQGPTTATPTGPIADDDGFPEGAADEKELLLQWLGYLRGAVLRKLDGIDDDQARWTPEGKLIPLVGVVNHLTRVEWRWIDGAFGGAEVSRSDEEFRPGPDLRLTDALDAYRSRATATDSVVRSLPLAAIGRGWGQGKDLRFVLLHLINETARHAGHADATREMLDGVTGE